MSRFQIRDNPGSYEIGERPVVPFAWAAHNPFATFSASAAVTAPCVLWPDAYTADWLRLPEETVAHIREMGVRVPEAFEVKAYIQDHPDLGALMVDMAKRATQQIRDAAVFSLEVLIDPEYGDAHAALMARYEDYPEDLLDRLDAINDEFTSQRIQASGWFFLSTDFQGVE